MKIEHYDSPVMVTWQLTRDCDLACLHCCTDSAPGKALPDELEPDEAVQLAVELVEAQIPYVMLAGGEPTLAPHFFEVAEALGRGGVYLKIETNGQAFGESTAGRLSRLPIRSVQVSIDGADEHTYALMRPGGQLARAVEACRAVRRYGMPLEVTFAPARFNIEAAEAVIDLAASLGAFRFNTGRLMRLGTAARLWERLAPHGKQYENFYRLLLRKEPQLAGRVELCFRPFSLADELKERGASSQPPGTLLILPDGKVKVSAALPFLCADLRKQTLRQSWRLYREAWRDPRVARALRAAADDEAALARANRWEALTDLPVMV